MTLSKIIQQKIKDENGWITPLEVKHAFEPLMRDFDTKLTGGIELRKDLIMTRLDNFKMELIRRAEQNLERELKRESQSNIFGRTSGQTGGEQADGGWATGKVPDSGEGVREGSASLGASPGIPGDSGDSAKSNDWRQGSGMGQTRPLPNKG